MDDPARTVDLTGLACVLVDDNAAVLEALESLLADEGVDVLGSARTGVEGLRMLETCDPDTVVVDVRLPDLDGIEVARRTGEIARRKPGVILYTSFADRAIVASALDAGARGVVIKDAPPIRLLEAISVVAAGGLYIDPRLKSGPLGRAR